MYKDTPLCGQGRITLPHAQRHDTHHQLLFVVYVRHRRTPERCKGEALKEGVGTGAQDEKKQQDELQQHPAPLYCSIEIAKTRQVEERGRGGAQDKYKIRTPAPSTSTAVKRQPQNTHATLVNTYRGLKTPQSLGSSFFVFDRWTTDTPQRKGYEPCQ